MVAEAAKALGRLTGRLGFFVSGSLGFHRLYVSFGRNGFISLFGVVMGFLWDFCF